jgi:hypothetical protein
MALSGLPLKAAGMDEEKSQQEQPTSERSFSQEQYEMLLRCSKKKDISEWEHLTGLQDVQDGLCSRAYPRDYLQPSCQSCYPVRKNSTPGYVFLTIQVLLGYILLPALVTRFAILFTAGGPAGKFSKPEKKPNGKNRRG